MDITDGLIRKDPRVAHRALDRQVDSLSDDRASQDQLPDLKKRRLLARDLVEGIRS